MEEKTVKASTIKVGDIILLPGHFPQLWPFYLIMNFLVRGYRHSMIMYGKSEGGTDLVLETILRCGPTISPLSKYFGKEAEVYRINHSLSDVFCSAIIAAGEKILERTYTFFDHFSIFLRGVMARVGFSGRIGHKYYPFYFCSEFLQVCFEDAPQFIDLNREKTADIYKKDILDKFPKARFSGNKIRLMAPYDFKKLPFLELIGKGKLTDE